MKIKILLIFSILTCFLSLNAEKINVKVHGRVSSKYSKLNDDFALFVGFNGAVVLNDNIILGAGGYVLATDSKYECSQECIKSADSYSSCWFNGYSNKTEVSDLSFVYGGAIVGYQFNPASFLDIELKGLVGGGRHSSYLRDYDNDSYDFKVSFFVFEPELALKLVITKYIAVAFGISYRVVAAMDNDTAYSFDDLSSFAGTFDICLGSF